MESTNITQTPIKELKYYVHYVGKKRIKEKKVTHGSNPSTPLQPVSQAGQVIRVNPMNTSVLPPLVIHLP